MAACEPIHFLDEALTVKHGGHEDQLSRKYWGMDRFRAQALESLLSDRALRVDLRRLALENLVFRYEVLLTGAEKRGGSPHAEEWLASKRIAQSTLESLLCR